MANEFYVTVEGTRQGRLQGESLRVEHQGKLTGISFHYALSSPREVASGMASGKRQHKPISFVKEWGAASPQLFQAAVTNETLTSVLFEFVRTNENGEDVVHHTVRLTNAAISDFEQFINGEPAPPADPRALERISMTFQTIQMENLDGQTSAIDELRSR